MAAMGSPKEANFTGEAMVAMLLFSIASSSLLLVNKLVLHHIPTPSIVSSMQFACSVVFAVLAMATGLVPSDPFEWRKVKPYLLYVGMFVATIYCNMKALQHSNVETIIVFRACCPLVVSVIEWSFMGRQLPSARSSLALLALLGGCIGYVLTDRAFKMSGWGAYAWVTAYFLIISVEMVYGKHIVGPHLGFASMWGPTLYTNSISLPPMMAIGWLTREQDRLVSADWSLPAIALLGVSCVLSKLSLSLGLTLAFAFAPPQI